MIALLVIGLLVLMPDAALADTATSLGVADTILSTFDRAMAGWIAVAYTTSLSLFSALIGLEFIWFAIQAALGRVEIGDFMKGIVERILTCGFFLAYIQNGDTWAGLVIKSFRQVAGNFTSSSGGGGGSLELSPGALLLGVYNFIGATFAAQGFLGFLSVNGMISVVSSVGILICYVIIAALVVLALVEAKIVVPLSILFAAFGAGSWTRNLATSAIKQVVAIGAKLMALQLVVGLSASLLAEWTSSPAVDLVGGLSLLGGSILILVLALTLPGMVVGMVSGHIREGGGIAAVASAAGAAPRAIGAAFGAATGAVAVGSGFVQAAGAATSLADKGVGTTMGNFGSAVRATAGFGGTMRNSVGNPEPTVVGRTFTGRLGRTIRTEGSGGPPPL